MATVILFFSYGRLMEEPSAFARCRLDLEVIEGYMSVGAVYVVLAAGTSLALFACMGIYAVRPSRDLVGL